MKNRTAYEKEERKILREQIHAAVLDNQFSIRETELLEYQGFQLILPANMIKDKPYIWIKREGKYKVELGDSEVGDLIRIDNFLDGLPGYIEKLQDGLYKMEDRKEAIEKQLRNKKGYMKKIKEISMRLEEIDRALGVKES